MNELKAEPLTAEAFAPYGSVIEPNEAASHMINEGTTKRYHALATVDTSDGGGSAIISRCRAEGRTLPIEIKMMERHPLGSQAFLPAEHRAWLVVVAGGERPGAKDLKVFMASGDQGVQYNKGTWHHPLLALEQQQDFWIIDRESDGDNLDEIFFSGGPATIIFDGNDHD